jgi:2-(1,2-epoxy-1,2-dihydrophenyl)acetyl-CoA isomerase
MADEWVLFQRDGPIATIILNRPERLNALGEGMRQGLSAAIETVAHDPEIRVAVITGAGRGFCSGGDIQKMIELKQNEHSAVFREYLEAGHGLVRSIRRLFKPVLASVNGPAAGAGMNLALACDLRIASDRATFTQAFARIGLHPDWGGTFFLPRLIGIGRAMEMFALGDTVNATDAYRLGIVNFVVPNEQLAEATHKLAVRLAEAPPLPFALLKQSINERLETELDKMMEYEVSAQMKCFNSLDFAEGLKAFVEKRKAEFKGN